MRGDFSRTIIIEELVTDINDYLLGYCMTDWIKLDTSQPNPDSSWLRSVGWEDGVLIVRIYDDDPDDQKIMRYEEVPKSTFNKLRDTYNLNGSVGSKLNELVIRNPDISEAQPYDSE